MALGLSVRKTHVLDGPHRGDTFEASSSGGKVEAKSAKAQLALGDLRFEDVGVALIELPIGGVAGIISPHVLFARQTVTLDFRKMEMTVAPSRKLAQDSSFHELPLFMSGGNPHLPMVLGERQARPVLLDSGAKVVERDSDSVTLAVVVEKPGDERQFRIQLKDSWNSRATWLITRPAIAYWREEKGSLLAGKPGDAVKDWLPAFMSFQASGANADLTFEEMEVGGQKSLCSRISVDATAKDKPAKFAMWDCAGNVWRTTRLEVTDAASGEVLWGFKQSK